MGIPPHPRPETRSERTSEAATERCACGANLISCHGCAEPRCLTCDPYGEYERVNQCCTEMDLPVVRGDVDGARGGGGGFEGRRTDSSAAAPPAKVTIRDAAPVAAPTYDRTPVDCLISELHEMVMFGWMTQEGFEQRVAQVLHGR
jgi:hypothetical protein